MVCEKLRRDGVKGAHLNMAAENRNGTFYEQVGFGWFPFVLDGGKSGEKEAFRRDVADEEFRVTLYCFSGIKASGFTVSEYLGYALFHE